MPEDADVSHTVAAATDTPQVIITPAELVVEGEFIEDEVPAPGLPKLPDLDDHYGPIWLSYAKSAARHLGFVDVLRWVTGHHYAGIDDPSPQDEFIEHEIPATGLPDLCSEYGLACLPGAKPSKRAD